MPTCQVERPPFFERQARLALKPFPNSAKHFDDAIAALSFTPRSGDRYPGFGLLEVRKVRIDLPEYRISQRKGLRVIFLYIPEKNKIIALVCYLKKDIGSEREVLKLVKESLKQMAEELANRS